MFVSSGDKLYRKLQVSRISYNVEGFLDLWVRDNVIPRIVKPGQFVMIRAWDGDYPFLPRPFAVVDVNREKSEFELVVKIVGVGTSLMKGLASGDVIYVTGPLGRGIELADRGIDTMVLLLRGTGTASATFLARRAFESGIDVYAFLSASTKERLVCEDLLKRYSKEVFVATDDGSKGYMGNAIDLIEKFLSKKDVDVAYTCGSRRFARYIEKLDNEGKLKGYVFLERNMACGVGFCHGCAVEKSDGTGYLLVCKDGPAFRVGEVILNG